MSVPSPSFLLALSLLWLPVSVLAEASVSGVEVGKLLQSRCVVCHQGEHAPKGLKLDTYEHLMHGSQNGAVVVAGKPQASELIKRVKGISTPRMPMGGPYLADTEIALLTDWVASGARDYGVLSGTSVIFPGPGEPVTYAHVAPVFAQRCVKCHSENGLLGPAPEGYVLSSYAAVLSVQDRARVIPGSARMSELVRRIVGKSLPRMPFDGPPFLTPEEMDLMIEWVEQGARDADGTPALLMAGSPLRFRGVLTGLNRVDDIEFVVTPETRRKKWPLPGQQVEVRGYLDEQGRLIAQRVRRR